MNLSDQGKKTDARPTVSRQKLTAWSTTDKQMLPAIYVRSACASVPSTVRRFFPRGRRGKCHRVLRGHARQHRDDQNDRHENRDLPSKPCYIHHVITQNIQLI